jgi:hypothetical protein
VLAFTDQVLAITKQVEVIYDQGSYYPRLVFMTPQLILGRYQKNESHLRKKAGLLQMSVSLLVIEIGCL